MQFCCAYCKRPLGERPVATCPHCRKTMLIPDQWLPEDRRRRIRSRQRAKDTEPRQPWWGPAGARSPATVLIILGIMVVVGGMLAARAFSRFPSAASQPVAVARRHLAVLRIALDRFEADCGRYPTAEEGLDALVRNPGEADWGGPYVNWIRPDPWRRPYRYRLEQGRVMLFSSGPDGQPGTLDDVLPSGE